MNSRMEKNTGAGNSTGEYHTTTVGGFINHRNYMDTNLKHKNHRISFSSTKFLPVVEAANLNPSSNLNSQNTNSIDSIGGGCGNPTSSSSLNIAASTNGTTNERNGLSQQNNKRLFHSPFASLTMDLMIPATSSNGGNASGSGKCTPASAVTEELVHQHPNGCSLTTNLWSSLTNLHNLVNLSPTTFTIKSIVNSNNNHNASQIQPPSQQPQQTRKNTRNVIIESPSFTETATNTTKSANTNTSIRDTKTTINENRIESNTGTATTNNRTGSALDAIGNDQPQHRPGKTTPTTTTSQDDDERFLLQSQTDASDDVQFNLDGGEAEYLLAQDRSGELLVIDQDEDEEALSAFYEPYYKRLTQFQQIPMADKRRLEKLFREIDVDGNGVIDFNDLMLALEQKGIKATHENVKHLILRSDINLDGDIDFAEFVSYCLENEKQLRVIFKNIDINDDGKIDTSELVHAFSLAGISVDEQEVLRLVKRIKADKNMDALELNFTEFRDYLLLHPTDSLQDLMRSWRFGTFVDFGEDGIMPVDFSENEIQTGMWWRHMLAGGVAGAVSRTSTAPLDRLKVFLQVRGAEFNGLGVCLRHMIQEGGVLSLWRGNGINVLKIAPETAMKFMAFDQLKRLIHTGDPGSEITIYERFLAGSLAGAVSQTVIYPMEVLKTRFCLRETGQYRGLFDAAQKIYSNGGIKNFYRGYVPNLIGILPYAGIDLTIYETLKKMYIKHHSLEDAPVYVCLTCGTISSTFGQIASYPLALIRTRMQTESGNHRSSMVEMFKTIVKREGYRGLYRGITANIMKVAPAVSISYVVYEYTRRPLGAVMS